jgi:hypothetical protein
MSAEIDWGAMGGPYNCVDFNLYGGAAQTISQIISLSVDNSYSGADVSFIFPDTGQTYLVPAYTPQCVFPVFTNTTNFYASSPNALASDVTRFAIHNDLPPPVSVPITQLQQSVSALSIGVAVGSTQLIGTGVSGTIEGFSVNFMVPVAAASFNQLFQLKDGTGAVIWGANAGGNSGSTVNALLVNQTSVNKRFSNGVVLVQTGGTVTGAVADANLYYRTP